MQFWFGAVSPVTDCVKKGERRQRAVAPVLSSFVVLVRLFLAGRANFRFGRQFGSCLRHGAVEPAIAAMRVVLCQAGHRRGLDIDIAHIDTEILVVQQGSTALRGTAEDLARAGRRHGA